MTKTKRKRRRKLDKLKLFRDLGYEPHPGQLEVHNSTALRRVLACGARWGKSTCAAMEAIAAVLQPCEKSLGWIVAPSYDVADRIFQNVREVLVTKMPHRIVEDDHRWRRLVVRNLGGGLSELRAKSADHAVSLLGEGLDWLVAEEAASLKASVWESALSQRLIDRNGWALIISTPRGEGWFHDLFLLGQGEDADVQSWQFPSWNNPHLNREVIERERERLPDEVFRAAYGGEFVLSEPPRCPSCNGPHRHGFEPVVIFQEGEEPGMCPECGAPTGPDGISLQFRRWDGEVLTRWIKLHPERVRALLPIPDEEDRPVLTPLESNGNGQAASAPLS